MSDSRRFTIARKERQNADLIRCVFHVIHILFYEKIMTSGTESRIMQGYSFLTVSEKIYKKRTWGLYCRYSNIIHSHLHYFNIMIYRTACCFANLLISTRYVIFYYSICFLILYINSLSLYNQPARKIIQRIRRL